MIEIILLMVLLIAFGASREKPNREDNFFSPEPEFNEGLPGESIIYKGLGRVILFISPFIFMAIAKKFVTNTDIDFAVILILLFISGAIFSFGINMLRYGRRLEAIPADQALAMDPRPPIVYFRSFQDDDIGSKSLSITSPSGGTIVTLTEEEQIVKALKLIGPVIALGRPGDSLPQVGAARRYVKKEEDWKNIVTEYVKKSRAVVMRAGQSEGFWWEFQLTVGLIPPERILILIPFSREEYQVFRKRAEAFITCKLPDYNGKAGYSSLMGCILFEENWIPHFRKIGWRNPRFRTRNTPLVTILEEMCSPFFAQCKRVNGEKSKVKISYEDKEDKSNFPILSILNGILCIIPGIVTLVILLMSPATFLQRIFGLIILILIFYGTFSEIKNDPSYRR